MREKKEINVQIGEQVRMAREQVKLTQEQLAEKLDVSPQYISDMERGVVGLSINTLKNLCGVLGVASDQILFGKRISDRGLILANVCHMLTEEEFSILVEIAGKYVEAITRKK